MLLETVSVGVLGATGYVGAELLRLLVDHPRVRGIAASSRRGAGLAVRDVLPHLALDERFADLESVLGADVDLLFCALPHGVAAEHGAPMLATGHRVIDLSGAHRLATPAAFERAYGTEHPNPAALGAFSTGLVELDPQIAHAASAFAVPGCFSTAVMLGTLPLVDAGLARGRLRVVGTTGSSGSGANPSGRTHHPERVENLQPYKSLKHQHAVELEDVLTRRGFSGRVDFVPVSAPLSRGILATSFVDVAPETSAEAVASAFEAVYSEAASIRMGASLDPSVAAVRGTMRAEIGWALGRPDERCATVCVCTAIDNLVRGGAGHGVQAMNAMFGWPLSLGLERGAIWP